jgi:hypothetical protein
MTLKVANRIGKRSQLLPRLNISPEQNIARRSGVTKETLLSLGNYSAGEAIYCCLHQFTGKQLSPAAFSAVQAALVWSDEPDARRR